MNQDNEKSHELQNTILKLFREYTNRIGETGLFPVSSFHTTVRTVRYTAVP